MSVIAVLEQLESRTCDEKLVLPPGRIDRTYELTYLVVTDDPLNEGNTIKLAVGLPLLGSSYPTDIRAICVSKKCDKVGGSPKHWKVTCSFQSHFDFDPASANENPLLRPPVYSISYEKGERAVREDLDDNDISNTADTPFVPPLTLSYGIPVISVTWNSATLSGADLADTMDCCNSDSWNGLDPGTALIRGIEFNRKFENNVVYWEKKATVAVRSLDLDGWEYTYLLDQGFYEKVTTAGVTVQKIIRGSTGEPLPEPSMLNGHGLKKPTADDPSYVAFRMRRKVAFSSLIPVLV